MKENMTRLETENFVNNLKPANYADVQIKRHLAKSGKEEDAREYISDIFGTDEEIVSVKIKSLSQK